MIVLFAKLADADDWEEVEIFAKSNEEFLKQYIELENGIPSHDTIQRVMGSIAPEYMQRVYQKWNELVNSNEGETLKKIICIDGKTMRATNPKTKRRTILFTHGVTWTVSVWDRKKWRKNQMRLQQSHSYWTPYR